MIPVTLLMVQMNNNPVKIKPTSKEVSVAQLPFLQLGLHEGLAVVDEEHAVPRGAPADDDVPLQEDLVLQFEEDGVDKVLVSVLEQRHLS